MKNFRRALSFLLVMAMLLSVLPTVFAVEEEVWDGVITIGGLEPNVWTTKYGNVYTDCTAEHFTQDLGLEWGDLAKVTFLDKELILPVVPNYSYVDSGKPALLIAPNEQGKPAGYAFLAINMGNFLDTYGIAYKGTDENGNWYWTAYEGVEFPITVTMELYEKEGYMAEYLLHDLNRTNNREDYADLTDEEFANFREVTTTGMGDDTLYRSSSPINPELGRNTYADAAAAAAGVKTFINLADNEEEAVAYPGFAETYYSQQNVSYLCLGVDFAAEDFQKGLAEGLRFLIANEGPYLIHCTEGKDRAGFVHAILECFMGASYEEVVADYMVTYYNYYGIEPGTEKYEAIANSNIIKSLMTAYGVEDLTAADLSAEAAEYLRAIGLTEAEIEELYVALGGEIGGDDPVLEVVEVGVPSTLREGAMIPTYITLPAGYAEAEHVDSPLYYAGYPVVFMIHGHGGNHNEWGGYDSISNGLAEEGFIVVTLDFPGCGASTESFTLNTMTNMKSDVLDVIDYVCENYDIDEDYVGGFGYSMGGRIVLELTAEKLYSFDAIQFVAPAEDLEDMKNLFGGAENWETMKAEANEKGYVEFTTVYGQTQQLSKEWFADLEKYPDGLGELAAANYEGNSLVLWATDDEAVSPWVSEGVADLFGSATLQTYANGHSYGFYGDDPYTDRITTDGSVGFFAQELAEPAFKTGQGYIRSINENGDITLTITEEKFKAAGLAYGDIVSIRLGNSGMNVIYGEKRVVGLPSIYPENGYMVLGYSDDISMAELLRIAEIVINAPGETPVMECRYLDDIYLPVPASFEKADYQLSTDFEDVDPKAWYFPYVAQMTELGIIKGKTETTFEPESNITRAEFATLLYRIIGSPSVEGQTEPFADVDENDWFYAQVVWAYNAGIIKGVSEKSFAPEENVTREQVATMLFRFTKDLGVDVGENLTTDLHAFKDYATVSEYAEEPMGWASHKSIIGGTTLAGKPGLYLDPQGNATRAQAAKILLVWMGYISVELSK